MCPIPNIEELLMSMPVIGGYRIAAGRIPSEDTT